MYSILFLGTWLLLGTLGFISESETTMLWSDMPGTDLEFLLRVGFDVKTRSKIFSSLVGSSCT